MTGEPAEIDPFALLTAAQVAMRCKVSVAAVTNWVRRGHLNAAVDDDGNEILDSRGKRMYRLVDAARADAKMAERRERMALRILASSAA